MLQMGSIYGQVSSPSPQQMQPPFYDSNPSVQGATGWVKTIKIPEIDFRTGISLSSEEILKLLKSATR